MKNPTPEQIIRARHELYDKYRVLERGKTFHIQVRARKFVWWKLRYVEEWKMKGVSLSYLVDAFRTIDRFEMIEKEKPIDIIHYRGEKL